MTMNKTITSAFLFLIFAAGASACSSSEETPPNGGGSGGGAGMGGSAGSSTQGKAGAAGNGSGTGGTAGSAGNGVSGGATSSGGAGASGGSPVGGAGSTATGGSGAGTEAGSAGSAPVGGSAGTSAAGSGGSGAVGTASFTIDVELASQVESKAPSTVGIVTWSVDAPGITSARIDFGLDTTYGMTAPVDLAETDYRTLLLGMKPEQTYHFRVVASDGTTTFTSDDQTVMTGEGPGINLLSSFTLSDPSALPKGFFITSFWRNGTTDTPFIFDTDGDIVWWYTSPQPTSGISRAALSADGKSIWIVNETLQGAPLQRVGIDGLSAQTYMNTDASHDITAVSGETMAYLDYGESDCDSIFEIDNAGTTREIFESTDVTGTPGSLSSCHSNAVRYSKAEDVYTFSDHRQDVAVLSRTGELLWKLTDVVAGGIDSWGGSQHGHQLLENGLIIYANDAAGMGSSQAIEFGLDGSVIKEFMSRGAATNFGDVQRLPNGSTIITYSTSSLIQVVNANDAVVLEVRGQGSFGYTEFRESLYDLELEVP
jgi:hypothetical protein